MEDQMPTQTEPVNVSGINSVLPTTPPMEPIQNTNPEPEKPKKGTNKKLLYVICFIVLVVLFFALGVLYEKGDIPFLNNNDNSDITVGVTCQYQGEEYQDGQIVPIVSTDQCGKCTCSNGTVECDYTGCDLTDKEEQSGEPTDQADTDKNMVSYDLMQAGEGSSSAPVFQLSFTKPDTMKTSLSADETIVTVTDLNFDIQMSTQSDGSTQYYDKDPNVVQLKNTKMGLILYRIPFGTAYNYTNNYWSNEQALVREHCGTYFEGNTQSDYYACGNESIAFDQNNGTYKFLFIRCTSIADTELLKCDDFVKNLEVEVL